MKRFPKLPQLLVAMTVLLAAGILLAGEGAVHAQDQGPLSVRVIFLKGTYNLDDPDEKISAVITLENTSGEPVWTQEGFSELGFHLNLIFKGPEPDGPIITSTGAGSPTPTIPPPKVGAEELAAGWRINMPIDEVRADYLLILLGQYKAWFSMPFVQYDPVLIESVDSDDDGTVDRYVAPHNAVLWGGSLESDPPVTITLTTEIPKVTSDIKVVATEYTFGEGSRPGMTKKPLTGVEVRLYKTSAIEAAGITPINYKTYSSIATNAEIPRKVAEETGTTGEYLFKGVEQDDYVVIAYASLVTDYRHIGSPATIKADNTNWGNSEIMRTLILLTNYRGKKSPGKSIKVTGSELLIIQPEYVEWTSNEEIYLFGFESLGDWDVEVSVEPPEGFVTDQDSLTESVTSNLKAVQFTITDEGSKWKPTKVKYKVKHKGKTKTIKSDVKVKLSKKLAKKKGVPEWGEEDEKKTKK